MSRIWTLEDERASARRTRRYFEAFGFTYRILDSIPVVEAMGGHNFKMGFMVSEAYVPVEKENEDHIRNLCKALFDEYHERAGWKEAMAMATADLALAGLVYPNARSGFFEMVHAAIRQRRLSAKLSEVEPIHTTKKRL